MKFSDYFEQQLNYPYLLDSFGHASLYSGQIENTVLFPTTILQQQHACDINVSFQINKILFKTNQGCSILPAFDPFSNILLFNISCLSDACGILNATVHEISVVPTVRNNQCNDVIVGDILHERLIRQKPPLIILGHTPLFVYSPGTPWIQQAV
jgi:hypothetical protein